MAIRISNLTPRAVEKTIEQLRVAFPSATFDRARGQIEAERSIERLRQMGREFLVSLDEPNLERVVYFEARQGGVSISALLWPQVEELVLMESDVYDERCFDLAERFCSAVEGSIEDE